MPIYGIEGQFGSGKSSLATYIAREVSIKSAKLIAKSLSKSGNVILSNIKMDKELFPNYYYFGDDKLLQVLRTCNAINDLERVLYGNKRSKGGLINWERKKFTKYYLFFDEVGALANNHLKFENNGAYAEYINQNRKNFEEIYILTAKGGQANKTLRQHVEWWYYVNPLSKLPILNDIGIIRRQQKDDEDKIKMISFVGKDQNGDYVAKQKPMDEFVDFFWKPGIWKYYDDLHKNIKDPEKYIDIDVNLLTEIIKDKKELLEPLQKEEFTSLNKQLNILLDNPGKDVLPNSNV